MMLTMPRIVAVDVLRGSQVLFTMFLTFCFSLSLVDEWMKVKIDENLEKGYGGILRSK